jgi:1-deoxy-D-xylulose-5-phosphate reductoisomerase
MASGAQGIVVLGSTGSIGRSTLDVLSRHPDRFRAVALTANRNVELLADQCARHDARYAVVCDSDREADLRRALAARGSAARVLAGPEALEEVVGLAEADTVMAAIVGAAGLPSALSAARQGKRLLLANKESMVIAGPLFASAAREQGAAIIPVDSEHNALFQALPSGFGRDLEAEGVEALILFFF